MSKKLKLPEVNRKNFNYPLVQIWWEDIVSDSSWNDIVDIQKSNTAICCSLGWLIEKNPKATIVMADFSFEPNGEIKQGGSFTTIPTKNVIKIKRLNNAKTKNP